MKKKTGIDKDILKIKLYLLAIGFLILAILLVKGNRETDRQEITDREEEDTEEEPQTMPEKESEEEEETPDFDGSIRVLLKNNGYAGETHKTVKLQSEQEMLLQGRGEEDYGEGTEFTFSWEEEGLILNGEVLPETPECFVITQTPETDEQKEAGTHSGISVASLERSTGTPVYEGSLEIWPVKDGFVLINELPLETYLKYVVPSEMPSGYSPEALKAQAVCARTYAYKHLQSYAYPEYEAHVNDSVSFQVYNNLGAAETTSQAVADTAELILTYQGQPITAYYYSTSCGYSGDEEVWWEGDAKLTPYLRGKTLNEASETLDMSSEEVFGKFISQEDETCFDSDVSWYRWEIQVDLETLSRHLNETLEQRYQANPEAILTKKGKEFQSISTKNIGTIQGIDVLERNVGGAIQKICVRGSKKTITAETEYNVRALLNVQGERITRGDGSAADGTSLLPSAYFTITPVWDKKGELEGFRFLGGGYGHGVGLSQNGANGMAKQGKTYEEILRFFYTDVNLTDISIL